MPGMCQVIFDKGIDEGQSILASAIQALKSGRRPAELLQNGYDQKTVDLALACR